MIRTVVILLLSVFLSWEAQSPAHAASLGDASMSTIVSNGPTASRLNVVLLSEGYRQVEKDRFYTDAQVVVSALLDAEPLRSYARFYNAFGIFVASEDSGSSHPNSGVLRRTYFNTSYDSYGLTRLLTLPPNDLNPCYAEGEGRVVDLLQQWLPDYDLAVVVVNDPEYGGSGGHVLVISTHALSGLIAVHEQGHTFAHLGDEYGAAFPAFPDIEEPNTTRETSRAQIKWRDWIAGVTPVPTPPVASYASSVGLFEGAHYHDEGWFRPKLDCAMRSLGPPFCDVCAEAIDLSLHRALGTLDSISPATKLPVLASIYGSYEFVLSPILPLGANGSVLWTLNGVGMKAEEPFRLLLFGNALTQATQQLVAHYTLESPFVKTDPTQLLQGVTGWTIVRDTQRPPTLGWRWDASGLLRLSWPVSAVGYSLEITTDLASNVWEKPGGVPIRVGDRWEQSFSRSSARALFRLRRP